MKKEVKTHYENPWLLGQSAVCQFLDGMDRRTLNKYLPNLQPRIVLGGKVNLYHKDDVDQVLYKNNIIPTYLSK